MKIQIRFPVELDASINDRWERSTVVRYAVENFLENPELSTLSPPKKYKSRNSTRLSMPDDLYGQLKEFSKKKNIDVSKIIFIALENFLKRVEKEKKNEGENNK